MGREIRLNLVRALAASVVLEAMLVAAILFWPDFEANIPAILKMVPGKIMGGFVDAIVRGGAPAYVVLQHFFKGCHMIGGATAILFASGAVAGEAHRGTMEIWLARPVTRRRLLFERYALGAAAVVVPIFATSATIPWLLGFVDEKARLSPFLLGSAHESIFLLAIYSLTFLFSAIGSRPGAIAFGGMLLLGLQFAFYLVMEATHFSIFRFADLEDFLAILATRSLEAGVLVPLLLFSAACFAASLWVFARRVP
jgi:ABC-type transport system involved in multi-copper enzyme maturation permease subunit